MDGNSRVGKIKLREYAVGDEPQIIGLLKDNWTYLRRDDALSIWRWLYSGSAHGRALIFLGTHDEKVIGHYAMFPLTMQFGTEVVKGGKAEGSAVHPDYRGDIAEKFHLGVKSFRVLVELVQLLFENAQRNGTSLIYAFPNDAALKPQIRAGYSYHPIVVHRRVLPIDSAKTVELTYSKVPQGLLRRVVTIAGRARCSLARSNRRRAAEGEAPGFKVRRMTTDHLDSRYEDFLQKYVRENRQITTNRDPKYVRWRFLDNPVIRHEVVVADRGGEITAMLVTSAVESSAGRYADIVDLLALKGYESDLADLIDEVVGRLRKEGYFCVRTWLSDCEQAHKYLRILRRAGFINLPTGVKKARLHLIYRMLDEKRDKGFAADPRNWYITMAFTEGTS
jgi:hypothetical protein